MNNKSKIRVRVGIDEFPYEVDEDGRVINNPDIIADYSHYTLPLEDGDAWNSHLPYNQENARKEVYDQLNSQLAKKKAKQIKDWLKVYSTSERLQFLNRSLIDIRNELSESDNWQNAVNMTRSAFAKDIVENIYNIPFGPDPTNWADFLGAAMPSIENAYAPYNLWVLIRWIRLEIARLTTPKMEIYSPTNVRVPKEHNLGNAIINKPSGLSKQTDPDWPVSNQTFPVVDNEKPLLTHAQISLIRIYSQAPITKTNAASIAAEYGHMTDNAGKVLLKKYDELDYDHQRLLRRYLEKDIEMIKPLLSEDALKRAESDLNKLRNKRY